MFSMVVGGGWWGFSVKGQLRNFGQGKKKFPRSLSSSRSGALGFPTCPISRIPIKFNSLGEPPPHTQSAPPKLSTFSDRCCKAEIADSSKRT